jgi:hypothetical protein
MPNFKVEITRRGTQRETHDIQGLLSKEILYEKMLSLLMSRLRSDWFDKSNKQMWTKTVAKTGEIVKIVLEEMEAGLITAVKELASCLMSLWRKLAYELAENMHIPSRLNNRNMSAGKMAYQFKMRSDLCLWNGECKIVVESCLLVLRAAFSVKGSDVLKKKWHGHTHTHTPYQQ